MKVRAEQLAAAVFSGHAADDETTRWVSRLEPAMWEKLACVGLVPKRQSTTMQSYLDEYFDLRANAKPATLTIWGHTRRNLVEFSGPN